MSIPESESWRLKFAGPLKGVRFQFRRYTRWSETWDHDHCAGCWAKFMESQPNTLHEGYTTCEDYEHGACYTWVCSECFELLKDELGWTLASERGS